MYHWGCRTWWRSIIENFEFSCRKTLQLVFWCRSNLLGLVQAPFIGYCLLWIRFCRPGAKTAKIGMIYPNWCQLCSSTLSWSVWIWELTQTQYCTYKIQFLYLAKEACRNALETRNHLLNGCSHLTRFKREYEGLTLCFAKLVYILRVDWSNETSWRMNYIIKPQFPHQYF